MLDGEPHVHLCSSGFPGSVSKQTCAIVQSVIIFEVTEPGFAAEQAVRIFVEFDREEAAMKATSRLGGPLLWWPHCAGHIL